MSDMTNEELAKWCDACGVVQVNLSGKGDSDTVAARYRLIAARLRQLEATIPSGHVMLPQPMTAQQWADAREQMLFRHAAEEVKLECAEGGVILPPLADLRPATSRDIVKGAVIYYVWENQITYWKVVQEVYRPDDEFKAYCALDGCRYGLSDAWVIKARQAAEAARGGE